MTDRTYTVGQVNSYIRNMLREDYFLQRISVKGEVSNLKYHPSGHIYFTLKDKTSGIHAVMFASNRRGLTFPMKDGDKVVVTGSVYVYERAGEYQLYARRIEQEGIGDLYQRFEELKRQLSEMGMFAAEYKKPIPKYAMRIGVVTAPSGAAVRDIIQISKRRNPYVEIVLCPALVQGEGAVPSIVSGIERLDAMGLDVLIVGRGGGSIEDLWAFNEEAVARAIFNCETPIISAVGHETDTTIADYVADLRAPTPSAAAELAVFDYDQFQRNIEERRNRLHTEIAYTISGIRQRQRGYAGRLRSASPAQKIIRYHERVQQMQHRLVLSSPLRRAADLKQDAMHDEERMASLMETALQKAIRRRSIAAARLEGLSPAKKLAAGFSFVTDDMGHTVRSAAQVKSGDLLRIHLSKGRLDAAVTQTYLDDSENIDGREET